jgi:hypothetical protein
MNTHLPKGPRPCQHSSGSFRAAQVWGGSSAGVEMSRAGDELLEWRRGNSHATSFATLTVGANLSSQLDGTSLPYITSRIYLNGYPVAAIRHQFDGRN